MGKLISKTYGDALFDLCMEENSLNETAKEIAAVKEIFLKNEELLNLLTHPKISKEEKISAIEAVFKGKVSDAVTGFLVIIVEKGRSAELNQIFDYFLAQVREYNKIGVAAVTSAIELTQEQKDKIEAKLLATTKYVKFEMEYYVDPSLIGGMVIRIGDRVVDSSIRTKLKMMSRDLQKIQIS